MKPIFFTGLEANDTGVWTNTGGTVTIVTTTINTGTYAMCHESAAWAEIDLDAQPSEVYISIEVEPEDVYSGGGGGSFFDIEFHTTDSKIIKLRLLQADLYWDAYVDGAKVADGTVSAVDGWHNIQIRVKIDNTDGTIQTYVDDTLDIIYSGDTKPGTSSAIEKIRISTDTENVSTYCYYDDIFVCVGGWPGKIYIEKTTAEGDSSKILICSGTLGSTCVENVVEGDPCYGWDGGDITGANITESFVAGIISTETNYSHSSSGIHNGAFFHTDHQNLTYGVSGDIISCKISVKARHNTSPTGAPKIALIDHFEPSGSKSEYSPKTNVGLYEALTDTEAWYHKYIHKNSRGLTWGGWTDLQYQEFGYKIETDGSDSVTVNWLIVEVARRDGVDPYQDDIWRFASDGFLITSWIHTGMIDVNKYFSAIKAFVRNVNTDSVRVYVDYKLDTDGAWVILEDNANNANSLAIESEDASELSLKSTEYATGKRMQLRFRFESESGTVSPDMIAYVLETFPKIPRRRVFTCPVRVEAYRENIIGGITYEGADTYYDALVAMVNTAEPLRVHSSNPIVDGTLVEVVGIDNERIIVDPQDPDQVIVMATITMVEVD